MKNVFFGHCTINIICKHEYILKILKGIITVSDQLGD